MGDVTHWVWTAVDTYLLHPTSATAAAWWGGMGGDLAYIGMAVGVWKHVNCEQPGCWRPGHRHPQHGRPVCRKHYRNDLTPEENPCP